jgi:hypothetical protein
MITKSDAERAKLYRERKSARAFADEYFDGETAVTPEEFISGKVAQFCTKHGVDGVKIKTSVVSNFYNLLHDRNLLELRVGEVDNVTIPVIDLLKAWQDAEKQR